LIILNAKAQQFFEVKLKSSFRHLHSLHVRVPPPSQQTLEPLLAEEVGEPLRRQPLNPHIEQLKRADQKDCNNPQPLIQIRFQKEADQSHQVETDREGDKGSHQLLCKYDRTKPQKLMQAGCECFL
jgi:hypothetical protein